jgi:hypothetical protein
MPTMICCWLLILPRSTPADRLAAGLHDAMALAKLTPKHRVFLAWRRAHLLTAAAARSVDG